MQSMQSMTEEEQRVWIKRLQDNPELFMVFIKEQAFRAEEQEWNENHVDFSDILTNPIQPSGGRTNEGD